MSRLININFENEKDFPITRKALSTIEKVMYEQDEYGFDKYKKALDAKDNYNWLEMFLQETADGLKYIQCEIERKAQIVRLLEAALRVEDKDNYILSALELLTIEGTGK